MRIATPVPTPSIDPATLHFARTLVRIKARQITRRAPTDRDDVEQELLLEVLLRWPKYDPDRASRQAFVEEVVRSRVCSLLRSSRRRPRPAALTRAALHEPDRHDHVRQVDVRLDVQLVVDRLRPRLREACDHLRRQTQSDTARLMGVNRASMLRALVKARALFGAAGLDSYL
jgi:RNA polymerase sigma-70 factor (ECF subfamily)